MTGMKKKNSSGYALMLLARGFILNGETDAVIPTLKDALKTDCRLVAALELINYYFHKLDYPNFKIYYELLKKEEKDKNILQQIHRMNLYFSVKVLEEKKNRNLEQYLERQIISYSYAECIDFLEKNRIGLDKNKLLCTWDSENIYEQVKRNLKKENVINLYDAFDCYFMRISKIGIAEEKVVNAAEIHTVHNTYDIVDIIPSIKSNHRKILIPDPEIKCIVKG